MLFFYLSFPIYKIIIITVPHSHWVRNNAYKRLDMCLAHGKYQWVLGVTLVSMRATIWITWCSADFIFYYTILHLLDCKWNGYACLFPHVCISKMIWAHTKFVFTQNICQVWAGSKTIVVFLFGFDWKLHFTFCAINYFQIFLFVEEGRKCFLK